MTTRTRTAIATTEPTRYQVSLCRGFEVIHVFGYTARKSKQGIFALLKNSGDVTHLLTESELAEMDDFRLKYSAKNGMQLAFNIYIRFTGTERENAI